MNVLIAVADLTIRAVMLAALIGGTGFSALLLHEQATHIRKDLNR